MGSRDRYSGERAAPGVVGTTVCQPMTYANT